MYLCLRKTYWTLPNKNISYFTIMWYADNMIEINQKKCERIYREDRGEAMKKLAVVSAMWIEAEKLHEAMTDVKEFCYNDMKFFDGFLEGCPLVLTTCGVGKINAAIYTQLLIDKFAPSAILHTGIAGSMDTAVKHLDFVVADRFTYHDVRKSQMTELFPYCESFRTDEELSKRLLESARAELSKENTVEETTESLSEVHRGMIITGDAFVTDGERKAELKKRFPSALCVEMEGCAVAHTAFVNKVPFGVIRCISDLADGKAQGDYEYFEKIAAQRAAKITIGAVRSFGKDE